MSENDQTRLYGRLMTDVILAGGLSTETLDRVVAKITEQQAKLSAYQPHTSKPISLIDDNEAYLTFIAELRGMLAGAA